jgi:hypothetical protein
MILTDSRKAGQLMISPPTTERTAVISCLEYRHLPKERSEASVAYLLRQEGKLYLFVQGAALPPRRGYGATDERQLVVYRVTKITGVRADVARRP